MDKYEYLSQEEITIFRSGCCPDCLETNLLPGPIGGLGQNVKCGNLICGSLFNDEWRFGVERLSNG